MSNTESAKQKLDASLDQLEGVNALSKMEDIINSSSADLLDKSNVQSLPLRAYLDACLIPAVVEGMKLIAKERPVNPVEYLGVFLLNASQSNE